MSERIRSWSAVAVLALSFGIVVAVLASSDASPQDRAHALAVRLKCPVCDSESIADSPSQVARDAYDLITDRVTDGWTDDEILDFFVATYGPSVLLDPPATGSTIVLWIAPVLALAIGGTVVAGRVGRSPRQLSESERRRVEQALEERR